MAPMKQTAIRVTASAGVGVLILAIQISRLIVRRFGPHPVVAMRGMGADVTAWGSAVRHALSPEEQVQHETADVLVEILTSGAAAVAEYSSGKRGARATH